MRVVADGVRQLQGFPPNCINVYLLDDVLVDAATPWGRRRVLRQLAHGEIRAHVVTHAHADHFGSSHAVCSTLEIPLWCGAGDQEAIESGRPARAPTPLSRLTSLAPVAGHHVDRTLQEGDEVAGFTVLEVPGHTPGHIALWRETDGVLLCGDVFFNLPRVGPPPAMSTWDPALNTAAMQRLSDLRPRLVLFGHGPPLQAPRRLVG